MVEKSVIESPVCEAAANPVVVDQEALFREARRLRRRRWAIRAVILLVLIAAVAAVIALVAERGHARTARDDSAAGVLPAGALTSLRVAGSLAVGPTGALYVADVARHRVLVRLPNGDFRIVAGTGIAGFTGNGGLALRAELSFISGLAFSPTGSLYVVDGGRVRVITPNGMIHTIAGDGRPARRVAPGTPARSAGLGTSRQDTGPSIAISPRGELYIATFNQVLRLTAHDTLEPVRDLAATGPVHGSLGGLGAIAVDGSGNLDVSGVNGWAVWQITPNGRAHQIGSAAGARQSGGNYSVLQRAPDGTVYAEDGPTILRVTPHHLRPAFRTGTVDHEYFWPTYFAFGPDHETYLDEIPGGAGFEPHQQLIAIQDAHARLLWQEDNRGRHDSFGPN